MKPDLNNKNKSENLNLWVYNKEKYRAPIIRNTNLFTFQAGTENYTGLDQKQISTRNINWYQQ